MANWRMTKAAVDIQLMSRVLGIDPITAQVLANRGIRSKAAALKYLNPDIRFLHDPFGMKDMDRAVSLVSDCLDNRGRIFIYGDYDVDGVMSTTILYKLLRKNGGDVFYYIPDREEEGYGLNTGAVRKIREAGADLILTCDNGIAALEEVKEAKKLGLQVVILDHHEPGYTEGEDGKRVDVVPAADAVVDPKQSACPYPFKQLCAGGLAYKFAEAFCRHRQIEFADQEEFLILASIATVCDIVDLQDENRVLVKNGLERLSAGTPPNMGLDALLAKKRLAGKTLTVFDYGFIIGPCINATGRLESAALSVELFTTEDCNRAEALADTLSTLNDERKNMTSRAVESAMKNWQPYAEDKVVVLYDENVHESIAGIVAGRIKETVYRPVIMLTGSGDAAKGSARSIEAYNIFEALYRNKDLFIRFGGHAMAAGLSMEKENIPVLRERLNRECTLGPDDFVQTIRIDGELKLSAVTFELAQQLQALSPFGKENREPLFGVKAQRPETLRYIKEKNTMIFTFPVEGQNRRIKAICFGLNESFEREIHKRYDDYTCEKILAGILRSVDLRMDMVYAVEINEYNNDVSVQIRIKDFRFFSD